MPQKSSHTIMDRNLEGKVVLELKLDYTGVRRNGSKVLFHLAHAKIKLWIERKEKFHCLNKEPLHF